MTIKIGEKTICKECDKPFRQPKTNSTIKRKICPRCQKLKDFKKQKEYNQKMLSRSNLYNSDKRNGFKSGKHTPKKKSGLNGKKNRRKSEKTKAMANADLWFSRYIRCKYHFQILTDGTVLCKCIISGKIKEAKKMDNGHCFSRKFLLTRYEEDNCRPQNRKSNRFSGEADHYKFRDNLQEEIGGIRFNRLDELRKQEGNSTTEFYREQSEKYRNRTNDIVKEFSIKKWW